VRMLSGNFAKMTTSTPFRDLLHAAYLRHGTDGFTSPLKEGVLRIFSPSASAGFEPANLGTKGQHATPRPPKLLVRNMDHKFVVQFPGTDTLSVLTLYTTNNCS